MTPPEAGIFLKKLHKSLNKQDLLLIGFDLMKNPKILFNAYNDSKGLFEKFSERAISYSNRLPKNGEKW